MLAFHLQAQAEHSLSSSVQCLCWSQASLGCQFKKLILDGDMKSCFGFSVFVGYEPICLQFHAYSGTCLSLCMHVLLHVNASASAAAHVYVYVRSMWGNTSVCLSVRPSVCLSIGPVCLFIVMHAQCTSDVVFCMPAWWMDGCS